MDLKINEAKHELFTAVQRIAQAKGFAFVKSNHSLVRTSGNYNHSFNLVFTKWRDFISVQVFAYIAYLPLELAYSTILTQKFPTTGITLGNSIDIIKLNPDGCSWHRADMDIIIRSKQDVVAACHLAEAYFSSIALQFFAEFSNEEKIYSLHCSPAFSLTSCPSYLHESAAGACAKGLLLDRMLNKNQSQQLLEVYEEIISDCRPKAFTKPYQIVKQALQLNTSGL